MLPDPLHPIVVHFPIVLSILLPLVAAGALYAVSRGARPMRAWGITIAVAAALTLSAWVATETGEQQEERVEDVVGESRLDAHASAGESLFYASIGVLAVLALGLAPANTGRVARYVGAAATLTVAAASFKVGMTGGDLVYKYDAASVYAKSDTTAAGAAGEKREGGEKGEKGEKDDDEKDE
ncbi:MAG: hypothetical protein HYV19_06160 [Gemmatimonadetes bacterium]|nr:hypothetical protein [Gemmatimonadota bacterium]